MTLRPGNSFELTISREFDRDFGAIFREDVQNVFLVKVTYWLGT